ncbi:MAG TPA: class I SAM-dependent methyltransferase [Mycobacterium sp.]
MRTDKDTWDITTSVGVTALNVAAARALEAQHDQPLAVDPYAEAFCHAAGAPWADVVDGKAPDHFLTSDFGVVFCGYNGARTRFFDNHLHEAAAAGVRQIVIVAAGLDSRAYRLRWPDGTVVFELDQPKVLEFKREVLAERGPAPTAERREVAADLREDWSKALRDSGFEPSKPTAWLVEGLLIYLPAQAQEQLYTAVDSLSAAGSRAALEEMQPFDSGDLEVKRAEEAAGGKINFFNLIYNERHGDAATWFGNRGWDAESILMADYYQQVGRPLPPPDTDGGHMLRAGYLVTATKR